MAAYATNTNIAFKVKGQRSRLTITKIYLLVLFTVTHSTLKTMLFRLAYGT